MAPSDAQRIVDGVASRIAARPALRRPFVTLSWAQGLDGSMARAPDPDAERLLLSGPASTAMTHGLRAVHDGICVGRGTIDGDDPRLTVRLDAAGAARAPEARAQPTAVILDGALRTPPGCALLRQAGRAVVVVAAAASASDGLRSERRAALERAGATVLEIESPSDVLDLGDVLAALGDFGIAALFVEGGATVIDAFLRRTDLVDDVVITIAPVFVGGLRAPLRPLDGARLEAVETVALGADVVVRGAFAKPTSALVFDDSWMDETPLGGYGEVGAYEDDDDVVARLAARAAEANLGA